MTTSGRSGAADTQVITPTPPGGTVRWGRAIAILLALVILAAIAYYASRGADAARIANPAGQGAPSPVRVLFGWTHWLGFHQIGTILMMVQLTGAVVFFWRRYPAHPILLMV